MKDIKARRADSFLAELISRGEHVQQDFKFQISDARKIAHSISAFANCSGGRLLIGVKDNGAIAGVRNEEDIYVIEQAATLYCRPAVEVDFSAVRTAEGQIVIIASVPRSQVRPVMAQESDLRWRAYYRVADENICAHPLMVRTWRHMASSRRVSFHIDGPEAGILRRMNDRGDIPVSEALLAAGTSRRAAEWAVVRLAALGLVDFVHTAPGWNLTLTSPES